MTDDEINEEGRKARFERWEKLGLDRVKHDLESGGYRVVGGTPRVRELAWQWVRMKEGKQGRAGKEPAEILTLKPGIWGISLDLKALWRRICRKAKNSGAGGRQLAVETNASSGPETPAFILMREAATLVYEQARLSDSIWALAAEKLGGRGLTGSSSPDEVLDYMATFISRRIPLYGVRPPSRLLEEIADAENRGTFQNGATEFRSLFSKPPYTNLQVKRSDVDKLIDDVRGGLKSSTPI